VSFKSVLQIVLQDEQIDRTMQGGVPLPRPPMVYGVFYPGGDANCGNNVQQMRVPANPPANPAAQDQWSFYDPLIYKGSFSIDSKHGVVMFPNPLFTTQAPGAGAAADPSSIASYSPAVIRLRTSFLIRDPRNFAFVRYGRSRLTGQNNNTQFRWQRHDEIVWCCVIRRQDNNAAPAAAQNNPTNPDGSLNQNYPSGGGNVQHGGPPGGPQANNNLVDPECDHYIDAMKAEYNLQGRETIKYAGLRSDIDFDGAICQISFDIDAKGTTTTASYNDEQLHRTVPFDERRRLENLRGHDLAVKQADNMKNLVVGKDTLT
jgi:hypothetical protein